MGLLPVTASVVPSSHILVTLMKGALSSSEMSVFTRATRRNIPEDSILYGFVCFTPALRINFRTLTEIGQLLLPDTNMFLSGYFSSYCESQAVK
jgi:hypothetical protein